MQLLRSPPAGKLSMLQVDGKIITSPEDIDLEAGKAWGSIYAGRTGSSEEERWRHALSFIEKYFRFVPALPRFQPEPLTPQEVQAIFVKASPSAPGPDAWCCDDLRYMPMLAAELLLGMFEQVQHGHPWPSVLTEARAVFLAKEGGGLSPYEYRILTITSHIYRKWAPLQLKRIEPWTRSWLPLACMGDFAGGLRKTQPSSWPRKWRLAVSLALTAP